MLRQLPPEVGLMHHLGPNRDQHLLLQVILHSRKCCMSKFFTSTPYPDKASIQSIDRLHNYPLCCVFCSRSSSHLTLPSPVMMISLCPEAGACQYNPTVPPLTRGSTACLFSLEHFYAITLHIILQIQCHSPTNMSCFLFLQDW